MTSRPAHRKPNRLVRAWRHITTSKLRQLEEIESFDRWLSSLSEFDWFTARTSGTLPPYPPQAV